MKIIQEANDARNAAWVCERQRQIDDIRIEISGASHLLGQVRSDLDMLIRRADYLVSRQRADLQRSLSYDQAEAAANLRVAELVLDLAAPE